MRNREHLERIITAYSQPQWQQRGKSVTTRPFKNQHLPAPKVSTPNWNSLKEKYQKLIIEIGCGAGHHPYQYAKSHPDFYVFAIEHTKTRFKQMQNLVREQGELKNLCIIHENAISWVAHYVDPHSIDEVIFMYPNPYPKAKDWNCRWVATPFWGHLLSKLKTDGSIRMVTNIQDYAEQAMYFHQVHWQGKCLEFKHVPADQQRTLFEKKYLERGETCYEMIFAPK